MKKIRFDYDQRLPREKHREFAYVIVKAPDDKAA